MQDFLAALNANSGAISLLLALVVAAATVFYAGLTHRLVAETRRMREVQTEPALSVRLEPSEHGINFVNLVVENLGQGAARAVRLIARPDFQRSQDRWLSELGLFRYGLKYMAPGQQITVFLTSFLDAVHRNQGRTGPPNFEVVVEYKTPSDRAIRETFPLHFDSLEGYGTIGTPPLIDLARSMEKLQRDVHHLVTGFSRLQVITSTKAEERRELEQQRERQQQQWPDKTGSSSS